ncbi:MAG TPA: hypothetical protein VI386_17815 [Candidatus Sulfotelmatobacter sp.]
MTTETKRATHTPGPWQYSEVKGDHVVHGPDGDCITWCNGVRVDNEANARLISAAPDMLAALMEVGHTLEWLVIHDNRQEYLPMFDRLKASVKKAKGE